jgi:hypothetical protein
MKWYQVLACILLTLEAGNSYLDYKERCQTKGQHLVSLLLIVVWITLLYFGGFWK